MPYKLKDRSMTTILEAIVAINCIILGWSHKIFSTISTTNKYKLHLHLRFDLHQHQTKQVWTTNKTNSFSITNTKTNNSNISIMKFHLIAALTVLSAVPGALISASANEVRSCADLFLLCAAHIIFIYYAYAHLISS